VDDELSDHLAEREAELRAQGLDPETARARARERFGDVATVRRELVTIDTAREQARRRRDFAGDLGRDLRVAVRAMRRSPGFTVAALVTLALGIGATTAIFSIVHAVVLQPLPYRDPSSVAIAQRRMPDGAVYQSMSYPDYLAWRDRGDLFESVAAAQQGGQSLDGPSGRESLAGASVTASFFRTLGVTPSLGRDFTPEDDVHGAEPVVIVSHRFWMDRLGGQPEAIGRLLRLGEKTYRLIGVLPASFRSVIHLPRSGDVWVPLAVDPDNEFLTTRNTNWLNVVVRLAPGIGIDAARAAIAAMSERPDPSDARFRSGTTLVQVDDYVSGAFRPALLMLLGAVGMLLLVACVNVSNLQLARTLAWRRELAIRAAIGAGRARLVVQSLTESLLLALAGGAAGTLVAFWLLPVAVRLSPSEIPRIDEAGLDLRVLAAALSLSVIAGLLSGTLPALRASRLDPIDALRQTGASSVGRHNLVRRVLIGVEVALTVVLLAGGGLLIASFAKLVQVDPGFASSRILTMAVGQQDRSSFFIDLLARVRAMPGVESAGAIDLLPLTATSANRDGEAENLAEGVRPEMVGQIVKVETRQAMPGYFETMRVPLVRGRFFTSTDTPRDGAIVTDDLARRLWGNADPIGRRLQVGPRDQRWIPVIGVVADVRHYGLDREPSPTIYRLADQPFFMTLVVRATGDPLALAPAIGQAARDLQPIAIVREVRTMGEVVSASVAGPRFYALVVAAFAIAAALLAGVGLFGLIAYLVSQRTHEMGIRVALGARRSQLVAMVVAGGLRVTAIGVVVGLLASLAATRLLASLLYDLSPTDPRVLGGVAVLMLAIAAAACYVPARRVLRVDPLEALRAE